MSGFALLRTGKAATPKVVQLTVLDDAGLVLTGPNGYNETVPWWRLFRTGADDSIHRFRRLGSGDWELRLAAGADQALLAHVKRRPLGRFAGPLRHLASLKTVAAVIALGAALSEGIPAHWMADRVPEALEHRLVDGMITSRTSIRCTRPGGEAALGQLLARLDPELGPKVRPAVFKHGELSVTAAPDNRLLIHQGALTEIEADALAALVAHELSHLRHGDAMTAAVRAEGNISIWFALLEGPDRRHIEMDYGGPDEERADEEAIAMMRRAGVPLRPAADMFDQFRLARMGGKSFGEVQTRQHYGLVDRARRWRAAVDRQGTSGGPALGVDAADDLFNFCWEGPTEPDKHIRPIPGMAGQPGPTRIGM